VTEHWPAVGDRELALAQRRLRERLARGISVEKALAMRRAEVAAGVYVAKVRPVMVTKEATMSKHPLFDVREDGLNPADVQKSATPGIRLKREYREHQPVSKAAVVPDDVPVRTTVRKDTGGNYARLEVDIADVSDRGLEYAEDPTSPAYRDAVAVRLGTMHVLAVRPPARKDVDVPGLALVDQDPFLHGKATPYVGGVDRDEPLDDLGDRRRGGYRFEEPDADAREPENFARVTEDNVVAAPASFRAPRPGAVGAVRVTKGVFRDVVFAPLPTNADPWLRGE
jgi:hypothetical protein